METRAPFVLIGGFVLAAIAAVFGFVYWLNNTAGLGPRASYHVQFDGSVPGLLVGAAVLFNGIRVGEVTDLGLAADNPRRVNATISVAQVTPVRADTKVDFARSQIGMVVRTGSRKPDIGNVDAFRRTLLDAKSIAYSDSGSGTYLSTKLFPKMGIADQIAGKSRKVRGPPSGEPVAAVVARGEAEIGFQQVSELIHVAGVTFVAPIPAELQPGFTFAGAVTTKAKEPDAAKALIRFLSSPEAAPVVTKLGLAPPR